jgi:hypothetical protein
MFSSAIWFSSACHFARLLLLSGASKFIILTLLLSNQDGCDAISISDQRGMEI